MPEFRILKKRADFLLAAGSGFKFVKPSIIVQSRPRKEENAPDDAHVRIGFTATKKLGNAIIRNRAKRRMRAAAAQLIPELGLKSCDYVFIGREEVYKGEFSHILRDMRHALKRLADQMKEASNKKEETI
ncbi:MAG TPA: ribonuclease P protein component [Rickettsiales bacterium]|nr:ribonuclease P protein component [Rickettsiales bacterium]